MMPGQIPQMPPGMIPPGMMAMQRPMIPGMPGLPPQPMGMPPGGPAQLIPPGAPRPPVQVSIAGVRPVS